MDVQESEERGRGPVDPLFWHWPMHSRSFLKAEGSDVSSNTLAVNLPLRVNLPHTFPWNEKAQQSNGLMKASLTIRDML